jgi:hypothetical protein
MRLPQFINACASAAGAAPTTAGTLARAWGRARDFHPQKSTV